VTPTNPRLPVTLAFLIGMTDDHVKEVLP